MALSLNFKKIAFSLRSSPESDWKKLIVIVALLTIGVVTFNVMMFMRISKGEIFEVGEEISSEIPTLDLAALKETTEYYQNKAALFEKAKNGTGAGVDPSI